MAVAASDAEKARYYEGSAELLASARAVKSEYKRGKVVEGTVASANFWNSEVDRINWFHNTFGTGFLSGRTDLRGLVQTFPLV
eukprot:COSAG02_NODE_7902_length_2798_cov_2.561319_2_plen_83_part_00